MIFEKSILMISNLTGQMGKGQSVCESLSQFLLAEGWRVYRASSKPNKFLRLIDMLSTAWKTRKEYRVGYVEVYSGGAFVWAEIISILLRFLNKPFVLALYGGGLPAYSKKNSKRVKRLLGRADVVVSPSLYTKKLMLAYCSNIHLLPYGVDFNDFHFRLRTRPMGKLITIRAFHEIYNLSLAPKVVSILSKEFPGMELVMTGGNKHDGSWELVQKTAQERGVAGRVRVAGFVPRMDLPQLLYRADILLNTPNVDNTPVSVLEAMACGLCIVSTNVGGIPYLLDDGQDALLVPPDNPEAMAAAVRRILTEPGLAEHLSQNARRKAERFDWSVILPQWEQLFEEIGRISW